jgi:DNA repair protein RadD
MHGDKISDKSILSEQTKTLKVDAVYISRHCKDGSPDSIRVQYRCGVGMYREWVCLDHAGFAGDKARDWMLHRLGSGNVPGTVNDALGNMFLGQSILEWTKTITVKKNGKFFEIVDYNRSAD